MSSKGRARREASRIEIKAAAGPQWWWYALGLFLVFFTVFEVYGPAIRGPFIFDDRYLPFLIPDFAQAPLRDWMRGVRPLLMLGYWLNYQVGQADPYWYHVVNVLFHFASGVCVWLILRRILEWAGVDDARRTVLSIFGGLLFLLHPLQTESVTYVASRSESQSVFFFNAAFVVFLYRRRAAVSWTIAMGVLVLFVCAAATKEHAAVLPALLLLTDYFWNPGFSLEGAKRNWRLYLPVMIGAFGAGVFIVRVLRVATTAGFGLREFTWYQYFYSQCRAIWVYLRMFLLPYGQNIDHEFDLSAGVLDHGAAIAMLALIAIAVVAWTFRHQYPLAAYGYYAFLILLAPTSSFVPIRDLLVERRVYLAFFPLVLICCEFLRRWNTTPVTLAGALAGVLCVFSFMTYQRNLLWADSLLLWKDTAEKSPNKIRPHFQLAYAEYSQGRCAEAAQEYERTSKLAAPDYSLYMDWGVALDCAKQPEAAVEKLKKAAALEKSAHVYAQIGSVYAKTNRTDESLVALEEAERLDPRFTMTYVYRGNVLLMRSDFDRAAEQFRKALNMSSDPAAASAARAGLDLAQRRVAPTVAP